MRHVKKENEQSKIEKIFERVLWAGRWTVLLAVIGGMLTSFVMFFIATMDVFNLFHMVSDYMSVDSSIGREILRAEMIGHAVEVIDGFLLAIVLLIFSYGIFELYVSKIIQAYGSSTADHLLKINSLDALKSRLGKVILMILIVKFFEVAVSMDFETIRDLMLFAIAIILIGITLSMNQVVEFITHKDNSVSTYKRRADDSGSAADRDT